MVKVIRPGYKKEVECPCCGAILSYTNEDLHSYTDLKIPDLYFIGDPKYIECPECGTKLTAGTFK